MASPGNVCVGGFRGCTYRVVGTWVVQAKGCQVSFLIALFTTRMIAVVVLNLTCSASADVPAYHIPKPSTET